MIKKTLLILLATIAVVSATAFALYLTNTAPTVPAVSAAEAAASGKPYVVKLHAQWCPVCMVTKGAWSEIEDSYAGRVNLVVLDFTNEATTAASEEEALRLGLEDFYYEHAGWTGAIAVLDGRRKPSATLGGMRDFSEYREAIEAVLAAY